MERHIAGNGKRKKENLVIKQTMFEFPLHFNRCFSGGDIYICNERKIQFRAVERNLAGTSRIGVAMNLR